MDTDELVEFARTRFDHESHKRLLREKYQAKMIFAHNNGLWRAGPELHAVLLCCPDTTAVILDLYENPVRVQVQDLLSQNQQRWQEQMTAWLVDWETHRTSR